MQQVDTNLLNINRCKKQFYSKLSTVALFDRPFRGNSNPNFRNAKNFKLNIIQLPRKNGDFYFSNPCSETSS